MCAAVMEEAPQLKTEPLGGCAQPGGVWKRQAGAAKAEVNSQVRKVGGFLGGHKRVLEDSGISEECEII